MFPSCHAACSNKPWGLNESLLPSLIPPYRWLSWWLLTRSFLSGPFLPPHRARRLQGGHGIASLPQRGGYYNCSLRICKPRCPSEAKPCAIMPLKILAFLDFPFLPWQVRNPDHGGKNMREKLDTCSPHYVSSANGNRHPNLCSSHY